MSSSLSSLTSPPFNKDAGLHFPVRCVRASESRTDSYDAGTQPPNMTCPPSLYGKLPSAPSSHIPSFNIAHRATPWHWGAHVHLSKHSTSHISHISPWSKIYSLILHLSKALNGLDWILVLLWCNFSPQPQDSHVRVRRYLYTERCRGGECLHNSFSLLPWGVCQRTQS